MARARGILSWLVISAVMLAIGTALAWLIYRQDVGIAEREQQDAEIDQLEAAIGEANDRLSAAGEAPVSVPETSTPERGAPGAAGAVGREGPKGDMGEPGRQGPTGPAGPPGTVGTPGVPGRSGSDGDDGAAGAGGAGGPPGETGPQGEPGATGPIGPTGEAGPAGAPGVPGRGIDHIACGTDGRWLIYYTDDPATGVPVEGPCRVLPVPEVTP
jgi:hypothetical protein